MNASATLDKIVSLCKRRGFAYPASDIYGGMANTWDFGHYGVLLKNNVRDLWWKTFVLNREDMVGIEASIFLNPKVWDTSGHISGFSDSMVDCKNCKHRMRADHLVEDSMPDFQAEGLSPAELQKIITANALKCPKCGISNFTEVRKFNLLFETSVGIVEGDKDVAYLRGEIAQGIFLNFKNVLNSMRVKIPFGIAQQGKAFRNEITMGQFIHRTLEFDLMEFEYFTYPDNWRDSYDMWSKAMWEWALSLGIDEKNLRWREHNAAERAHYSKKTMDIEYEYPFGFKEMFGLAYRTDFDLKNHMEATGKDLNYRDPQTGVKFIPHVIEPTFGLSRMIAVLLTDAYREETVEDKTRIFLQLHPSVAPVKVAVFPLQRDEKLSRVSKQVYQDLKAEVVAEYDDAGNIGKMYRRQDEIGTPFCVTVDYQTLEDQTVTVRERDSMQQKRVAFSQLNDYIIAGVTKE